MSGVKENGGCFSQRRQLSAALLCRHSQFEVQQADHARANSGSTGPCTFTHNSVYYHLDDDFSKLVQKAGLPHMPFHDLRHSAATILIGMGINPKVIQELLGHSDISITLGIYGHLFPTMQRDVVEKWQDVFGEKDEDDGDEGAGDSVPV